MSRGRQPVRSDRRDRPRANYLGRIEAWLDLAYKNGLFVSFNLTDNLLSPDTSTRGTLAQEISQRMALATLLDQYPNVVALDILNEINGWQVQRGGPGTYASRSPTRPVSRGSPGPTV
jgi:hypothetical protein